MHTKLRTYLLLLPAMLLLGGEALAQVPPAAADKVYPEATPNRNDELNSRQRNYQMRAVAKPVKADAGMADLNRYLAEKYNNPKAADSIFEGIAKRHPNTFAHHYAAFKQEGYTVSGLNSLAAAIAQVDEKTLQNPAKTDFEWDLPLYYELTHNPAERDRRVKKLVDDGFITEGTLDYNRDVLAVLKESAILVTYGFTDTYPIWYLQSQGIRQDVQVVNLKLMDDVQYYLYVKKNYAGTPKLKQPYMEGLGLLLQPLTVRPVFVGLTVPPQLIKPFSSKLYLIGLAYQYSEQPFDNLSQLMYNWESKIRFYNRDGGLQPALMPHSNTVHSYSDSVAAISGKRYFRDMNSNYLLPLLTLYGYYMETGQKDKAAYLVKEIAQITVLPQEKKIVEEYYRKYEKTTPDKKKK